MSKFTAVHMEAIAAALKKRKQQLMDDHNWTAGGVLTLGAKAWANVVYDMSEVFRLSNPAFDEARFRKACEPDVPVKPKKKRQTKKAK